MTLLSETLSRLAQVDPDRVRAAQLASPAERDALMVLYAFHAELAKVPELVSEPMLGQIRYQWWRDAVDEIYAGKVPRKHEVVEPLAVLIRERGVPRFWIDKLIDGRERDLDPRPFQGVEAAQDYARATSGTLMQLAANVLGADEDERIAVAGEAWGLIGLARSYRFYKASMLQHLDQGVLVQASRDALRDVTGTWSSVMVPGVAYAAFVPLYAKAMSRRGHDPAKDSVEVGAFRKQAKLMRVALSGRV